VACVLGIIANIRSNSVFQETIVDLNSKASDVYNLSITINVKLQNVSSIYTVPENVTNKIQSTFSEVDFDINEVSWIIQQIVPSKDIYAYVSTAWIIILGIVALLFVFTGRNFLFYAALFMAWCVLCGVCIFMVIMFIISLTFSDVCNELSYKPSMLDLIQHMEIQNFDQYNTSIFSGINDFIDNQCTQINQNCQYEPTLCPCNSTTFPDMPNKYVEDASVVFKNGKTTYNTKNLTVHDCASFCSNAQLKSSAVDIMQSVNAYNSIVNLTLQVQGLIVEFTGPEMEAELNVIVCHTSSITVLLWIGCALLLAAMIILGITILVKDRLFMDKQPYQN